MKNLDVRFTHPALVDTFYSCRRDKRLRRILIILLAPNMMGEAPFRPLHNEPDYTATYVDIDREGQPGGDRSTVTHHADWTRVDHAVEGRPATQYYGPNVIIGSSENGDYAGLGIDRGTDAY